MPRSPRSGRSAPEMPPKPGIRRFTTVRSVLRSARTCRCPRMMSRLRPASWNSVDAPYPIGSIIILPYSAAAAAHARTPADDRPRRPERPRTQDPLAVGLDGAQRQPPAGEIRRRRQGRGASGVLCLDGFDHDGAVFSHAAARGPGRGEAARLAGVPRDPISRRQSDAGKAAEFPRARRRAVLSEPDQRHRRCRLLHRLGGPRRRDHGLCLTDPGLSGRTRLDERCPARPDDRAGRRCRAGRGQRL